MEQLDWTKKLYFIISSPRSVSSMLRNKMNDFVHIQALPSDMRILEFYDQHSSLFSQDQAAFRKLFKSKYEKRQGKSVTEELWKNFLSKKSVDLQSFFYEAFELWATALAKPIMAESIFVEKSPNNIYYIKEIRQLFPEAKVIYLHRDPRDVVSSLNTKWWAAHNTVVNAKKWKKEQQMIEGCFDYKIPYESLTEDPESEMIELLKYMAYPDLDEVHRQRQADLKKHPSTIAEPGRAIHKGNQSKYIHILSQIDRELEIIEGICRNEMVALGYKTVGKQFYLPYHRKKFFLSIEYYVNRTVAAIKGRREY